MTGIMKDGNFAFIPMSATVFSLLSVHVRIPPFGKIWRKRCKRDVREGILSRL